MSGLSPSRVHTKTSQLADFFRGHPSRHVHHEPVESPKVSQDLLDVPQAEESSTLARKMTTRIPFLGRTRKKSTHSVKSGGLPSTSRGYDSEVAETTTTKSDRRLSHPVATPEPASRHPPLPTAVPQINVPSTSFGSKFVAHFSNVKSRKAAPSPRNSEAGPSEGSTIDTLSPPVTTRPNSIDSASTNGSANRPSTPRAGPTITVSSSPDSMEEYKDLFTLPRHKKSGAPRRVSTTPASEYRDNYQKSESTVTLTASPPSSPRTEHTASSLESRAAGTSKSDAKERESRRLPDGSRSSKIAKKRHSGVRRPEDSIPDDSTEESVRHVRPVDAPPVIDVTPPPPPSKPSSPTARSRLRPSSSAKDRPTNPPSIPLPAPPITKPPAPPFASASQASSLRQVASPSRPATTLMRPRANTIDIPPSPASAATFVPRPSSPKRTGRPSTENPAAVKQGSKKENTDLETMTAKQLKQALLTRNQQYDELMVRFREATKNHAAEKRELERKIVALEAEAARKDKEIQGFTWMLNNRGATPPEDAVSYTHIPGPRTHRSPSAASRSSHKAPVQYTDDSGAESHATSGAESLLGSESSMSGRAKRGLRPLTLGESNYSIFRSPKPSSRRGPAVDSVVSDQSITTSVYSLSSCTSATSSASSLLPPSPSVPISSLSAIPEAGTVTAVKASRMSTSGTRDSLSASEWETDDKRTHSSRRISTSSFSSSSSAATSAYSANLRRGRPPSIAQVLQKSPTMEEVLDRLRPFSGSPTPST
ncbi:hypothetical protein LshimejAT787_0704230 [Lyophyllum shimeji]|uniref:Uncharacterized protein n=1 Tax=Lyophyllum shimeji TaxID=47721 RepID=A0A9P3PPY6_LYOSH|nr:hypothetical protein LshimejAT787_0704230 [Lyophyllum shimeji]